MIPTHDLRTPEGISVVVPCFNSEATLPDLVTRLEATLAGSSGSIEIILVNDGSRDGTWQCIRALALKHSTLHGVNLVRNFGQHNALLCGIRMARFAIIVTLDDDLQHPPEEIPRLLAKLAAGYDVVYGSASSSVHGLWRGLASWITKTVLQRAMGPEVADKTSAFRAFRSAIREAFAGYDGPTVVVDVLLTWGTSSFAWIPVRYEARRSGRSNYTLGMLLRFAMDMMTGFSVLPLRLATLLGLGCALFGLFVLAYVVIRYFVQGTSVAGFPFLASTIALFAGAQMVSLGIMGEYIARIQSRLMRRPVYLVREEVRHSDFDIA